MQTYTLSYFVKNVKDFEDGATVVDMGNGWFRVSKTFECWTQEDAIKHSTSAVFPIGSAGHTLSLVPVIQQKPKRTAAWKQNPLTRFATRSNR